MPPRGSHTATCLQLGAVCALPLIPTTAKPKNAQPPTPSPPPNPGLRGGCFHSLHSFFTWTVPALSITPRWPLACKHLHRWAASVQVCAQICASAVRSKLCRVQERGYITDCKCTHYTADCKCTHNTADCKCTHYTADCKCTHYRLQVHPLHCRLQVHPFQDLCQKVGRHAAKVRDEGDVTSWDVTSWDAM